MAEFGTSVKTRPYAADMTVGSRRGMLTLVGHCFSLPTAKWNEWWGVFRCDCGNFVALRISCKTKSCGCYRRAFSREKATTHGLHSHQLYNVWTHIKQRCCNPRNRAWRNYGGRGIVVCPEWTRDFRAFYEWAVGNGYEPGLEIDRRDNSRGYSPDNCRFVTGRENCRNTRANHAITAFGETKTLVEWSDDPRCQCDYGTLQARISSYGYDPELSITTPPFQLPGTIWTRGRKPSKKGTAT